MDTLKKMALGEIQGYDVRPAVDAIKTQVRSPAFSLDAIETLGRLQGEPIQAYLASLVGNPANDAKAMRTPAVLELNRHLQRIGVQINKKQVDDLKRAATLADEGSALRNQLNVTVGIIARASAPRTGAELLQFRPDPPAKEKEKEEKKEKEKEKDKDN